MASRYRIGSDVHKFLGATNEVEHDGRGTFLIGSLAFLVFLLLKSATCRSIKILTLNPANLLRIRDAGCLFLLMIGTGDKEVREWRREGQRRKPAFEAILSHGRNVEKKWDR